MSNKMRLNLFMSSSVLLTVSAISVYIVYKYFTAIKPKADRSQVVFVLGGPGSGKGTNCTRIVEEYGYVHLSAGDLLRAERTAGSKLATMINECINDGKIVPSEVTVRLLKNAMEKNGGRKFLIDGFPRDISNLDCWHQIMASTTQIQFLLFLDCPHNVMIARLIERGKTSGRTDDDMDCINKRLLTYEQSTRPIIDIFRTEGKIREVDANRSIEEVFAEVSLHFANAASY